MKIEDLSPGEYVVTNNLLKSPMLRPIEGPLEDVSFLQLTPDSSFSCKSSMDSSNERKSSDELPYVSEFIEK